MFHSDEPSLSPSLISEKQEIDIKREREVRCGRLLWSGLGYTFYAAIYIAIVIM
jgi:hypothetical protein